MAVKLPRIGVESIVLGADQYFRDIARVATTTDATSKSLQGSAKGVNALGNVFSGVNKRLEGFGGAIKGVIQQVGGGVPAVDAFLASTSALEVGLAAASAAATLAVTAFIALGTRGAGLVGLAESFDRLNQAIGVDSIASLARLRVAAGGTVADFELIRLTNLALAGAVGVFGREFGEKLPRLLEIARVQARATGQDVGFLFQSLITGIKRGSPLLIDNTGLVLKVSAANEAMAASLGKSVEQLTAEEKQMAILNATLAAGQTAIDAFAGIQETSADKMMRMNATITNILDTLAIGVQPAFGMFLDVINRVLAMVGTLVTAFNPLISSFLEAGAALVTGPLQAILAIIDPVVRLIGWFTTLATVIIQPVLRAFTAVFNAVGTGVQRVMDFIGGMFASIGLTFDTLALSVGVGAGAIIAAMGNAMLEAYNAVVAPVVLFIATAIADFLVGESPPPKGPLSQIDKGGAAVMMAWAEGFAGVGLQPVEEVAANVNMILGDIGKATLPQVEARLGQLDAALQPFNDQLAIVKANFDAINEPAKAALDSIDRQMGKALQALSTGAAGSAELVRSLDAQREKIEDAVNSQQNLVDNAQIQQALAAAQQGEERTLLSIQQARLKAQENLTGASADTVKAVKAAAEASKGLGGAGAGTPDAAATGGADMGAGLGLGGVGSLISGQSAVDQMGADLGTGFSAGFAGSINQGTLAAFQENQRLIGAQTTRIGQANIGERISSAFTGIGTSIQTALTEASRIVSDWIGSVTDPARAGSIPYAFNALASGDYSALVDALLIPFDNIAEGIATFIFNNFDPENVNSILGTLFLLPTRISNALSELGATFEEAVFVPIENTITDVGLSIARFFVDTGEGTLSGMLDAGVAWFVALPQRIFNAISSVGSVFFAAIATPVISALNVVIEGIESMINYALSALGTLIGSFAGVAEAVGFGDQLAEIQASLVGGINLPRISMPVPPSPVMPAARAGGLFGVRVHRGEQVMGMGAGQKMAVFPRTVTRNLDLIASVLGQAMPLSLNGALAGGGNSNSTVNNTNNFNMPQPASSGNSVQMVATQMAMRKR